MVGQSVCVARGSEKILAWYTPSTDTWSLKLKPKLKNSFGAVIYQGGQEKRKIELFDMKNRVWCVGDRAERC